MLDEFIITRDDDAWEPYLTHRTEPGRLKIGSYTVKGLQQRCAVRRLTVEELATNLIYRRGRFEKELSLSCAFPMYCVIVEGSADELFENGHGIGYQPDAIEDALIALQVKYRVPFLFAGNRKRAAELGEACLKRYLKECCTAIGVAKNALNEVE